MPRTSLRHAAALALAATLVGTGLGARTAAAATGAAAMTGHHDTRSSHQDGTSSHRDQAAPAGSTPRRSRPISVEPAGHGVRNPYSPAYGKGYRHGVVPSLAVQKQMNGWEAAHPAPATPGTSTGPKTLAYGGGIDGTGVQSGAKVKVYLVFYGSQWGTQSTSSKGDLTFSGDAAGAAPAAQEMFKGIGTNGETWSADLTQWCDGSKVTGGVVTCPADAAFVPYPGGGVLAGTWYDNSAPSPSNATGKQLGQEAVNAASHFGNVTAASNRNSYYVIMSPHGTDPDNYQGPPTAFCAWHSWTNDAALGLGGTATLYGDIAFSNQPYNIDLGSGCGAGFINSPGTLDGYTITLGHEWHELMSDQNPYGGWSNLQTSSPSYGEENSDECAWIAPGSPGGVADIAFATGTFAEQSSWSNDTNSCAISHPILTHDVITVNPIAAQTWTTGVPYQIQASGSSSQGKALSWSVTGLPAGLSIAVSTGLITGTPLAAGSGTATVTASDSTPASASTTFTWRVDPTLETVTVTNPGGQTGVVGTAASLQISAQDSSNKALTYSATGLPAGLSIAPLTGLISGTPTAAGTYAVTVTATSSTPATGSALFSWTINPAPVVGITNGGFETGTLAGWTTAGTASVTASGPHSGTFAAQLGGTVATNGDSTASQRFTVPTGYAILSFWYNITCPDKVAYDWATVTLTDTVSGGSSTLLAKTCAANSGWTKASGQVVPGRTYTLTLVSHDDNSPLDPTYAKFDDVALTPNPIVNGGFETGTFSGWTISGVSAAIVSGGARAGTYAARLGSTSPTSGDSVATQTFTAAGNDSALYFWYKETCPDTVTYDWATATLKDNTTGTTSTILAKTCVAASGWTAVGATITPGHSYTLTLTNHDDNRAGNATYTLFDDVLVG